MDRGRTPAKKFTHIGDVLAQTLRNCRRETNETLARVGSFWPEVVGGTLGEHSCPAAMKGRLLLVHVNSSVWLHEMRFLKEDMIKNINRILGQPLIRDIKFKVGAV